MASHTNTNVNHLGNGGNMYLTVTLQSQNLVANTSTLHVYGELENTNGGATGGTGPGCFCSLSGEAYFEDTFSSHFDAHERRTIISHVFTIPHNSNGDLTAGWTFHIGNTGTSTFGGQREVFTSLFCPHISQPPNKPGTPSVASKTSTTLNLTWAPPSDHDDTSIVNYKLKQYNGNVATGIDHIDTDGLLPSRTITDLVPGATYTFTVIAYNSAKVNAGASPVSNPRVITMSPGPNIRVAGVWTKSTVFVRHGGEWAEGIPFVRSGGVWKQAI